jgi:hypothetical protein
MGQRDIDLVLQLKEYSNYYQYCRTPLRFYLRLLHNELLLIDPNYARRKIKLHFIMSLSGGIIIDPMKIEMDSKLSYNKYLKQWYHPAKSKRR